MEDTIKVMKTNLVRKTRKNHQCWECGKKFPEGSEMINTTFSYDNRLISVYKCVECS
jgi:DNA-directed RNA polymerase subunit RPC12/RpoP